MDDKTKQLLIIAYATGYENGHHDTVEGTFYGNGRSEIHFPDAAEWLDDAETDGTFEVDVDKHL